MSNSPFSAGPLLPDTGASTKCTSGRCPPSLATAPVVASAPMVPICAQTAPGENEPATPPSKTTEVITSAVGSIVITTSAFCSRFRRRVGHQRADLTQGCRADGERSHTVVTRPAATSRPAIAEPMMPVPSTATRRSRP